MTYRLIYKQAADAMVKIRPESSHTIASRSLTFFGREIHRKATGAIMISWVEYNNPSEPISHLIRLEPNVALRQECLRAVGPEFHLLIGLAHLFYLFAVHSNGTSGRRPCIHCQRDSLLALERVRLFPLKERCEIFMGKGCVLLES